MKRFAILIPLLLSVGCALPSATGGRAELGGVRGNLVDIHNHLGKSSPNSDDIKTADADAVASVPLLDSATKSLIAAEEFYKEWKDAVLGPWTWNKIHWIEGITACIVIGFILLDLSGASWLSPAVAGAMTVFGHLMSGGLAILYGLAKKGGTAIGHLTAKVAVKAAPVLAKAAPTPDPVPQTSS